MATVPVDTAVDADALKVVEDDVSSDGGMLPVVRPDFTPSTEGAALFLGPIGLPYLAITYGVGGLLEAGFTPGDLVLGKEYLIAHKQEPVKVIILSHKQYIKEYVTKSMRDESRVPRVFANVAEAAAAGFTTKWGPPPDNTPPTAAPAMTWAMLIEKPENIECALFCIRVGDKAYAPAYMALEKKAYQSVKDVFGMAVNYIAKVRGLPSLQWTLHTQLTKPSKKTGNVTYVPVIKLVGHLSDAELTALKAAVGGPQPA